MGATNSARRLSKPVTAKNKNKTGAAGDKGYRKYLWTLFLYWIPSDLLSTTYCDFPHIHYSEEVTWLWRWRMTRSSWPMLTSPSWIFWRGSSRDMCRCPERAGCGRWVSSLQSWSCLWVKNAFKMTYYYKMNEAGRHTMIQVSEYWMDGQWFNFSPHLAYCICSSFHNSFCTFSSQLISLLIQALWNEVDIFRDR